ncbi:MAG: metallophosphoesterase [DPANN group archaeon]|nr:metallophosphoesterase [DPANN group archaeon]
MHKGDTIKIAIFSDTHFGFGTGKETETDSYDQAEEAFTLSQGCDLIIVPGDIFDSRVPKQDVLAKALNLFFRPKELTCETELIEIKGKNHHKIHPLNKSGIPIIAIAGTHERRGKDVINPVELMDQTGYLINLHGETVIYKKDNEKVAITGISGVPETFAKDVFEKIDPKPENGCANIFLMHQSVGEYVYTDEKSPGLELEQLPKNFDLIVNGHIHWRNQCHIGPKKETLFLLPGSTITTQIRKNEAEKDKGITIYDTETKTTEFLPLKSQRKVIYKEIRCDSEDIKTIKCKIIEYLTELEKKEEFRKKPLLRIKVLGKIQGNNHRIDFSDIIKNYEKNFILSVKNNLESETQAKNKELVAKLIENRMSIDSMGLNIMKDYADKEKITFNYNHIFELLADGNIDSAEIELLENITISKETK